MKTMLYAMLFVCIGCATGDDTASLSDDAGSEAETSDITQQGLCCQVNKDIDTDAELWQNYTYSCSSNEPPWICNGNLVCNSSDCKLNDKCEAFNGYGLVTQCPDAQ